MVPKQLMVRAPHKSYAYHYSSRSRIWVRMTSVNRPVGFLYGVGELETIMWYRRRLPKPFEAYVFEHFFFFFTILLWNYRLYFILTTWGLASNRGVKHLRKWHLVWHKDHGQYVVFCYCSISMTHFCCHKNIDNLLLYSCAYASGC